MNAGDVSRWDCHAEDLYVDVRLITAPLPGRFLPCEEHQTARLVEGDEIGVVLRSGELCPIRSPFAGRLMGLLVLSGERVVTHQPLAWLMTDAALVADSPA